MDPFLTLAAFRVLGDPTRATMILLHPSGLWVEISETFLEQLNTGLLSAADRDPLIVALAAGLQGALRRGCVGQHDVTIETLPAGTLVAELRRVPGREAVMLAGVHARSVTPADRHSPRPERDE